MIKGINGINGMKRKLIAAVASSVCAGTWLFNCILDVFLHIPGALTQDAALTLLWLISAACWWALWAAERRQNMGAQKSRQRNPSATAV